MASLLRLSCLSALAIIAGLHLGSCSSVDIYSAESCSASLQLCKFIWTNRARMIEKIRDRLKYRTHKYFLRFKVPVYYLDAEEKWKQATDEFETWVSVADTHEYMLHFPHNFNVLSLGTMGIITDDFWGPDGKWDISGYCDKPCAKLNKPRCNLSRGDVQKFVANVTSKDKQDWNLICLQLDYDVNDVIRNPNTAIPDIFYYWRFLRQLLSKRPYLGKGISKTDFVHYNCYDEEGQLHRKELLMNYFVILIIAIILWLFSPLLVHFFPSSEPPTINYPGGLNNKDFYPTYTSPVYFGCFLRCILCFYMEERKGIKSRIRRFVFFSFTILMSFRLLYTPYQKCFVIFSLTFLVAVLIPGFFSVYVKNAVPTHFLGLWKYPEGVIRENRRKKEYQLLAHCLVERMYLISDLRFWRMLVEESFKVLPFTKTWGKVFKHNLYTETVLCVFFSVVAFAFSITTAVLYYFAPAFYFYEVLFHAIYTETKNNIQKAWHKEWTWRRYNILLSAMCFVHGVILAASLVYLIVAVMFCCYLLAEVTMFTYFGAVLVPSMAFRYVALVGSVSALLYNIAKDLRENYDRLRDQVVKLLENSDHLTRLNSDCTGTHSEAFNREPNGALLTIELKTDRQPSKVILYRDHFATYLSRSLLDFCIEECDPLRRQILFIIVEVFLVLFYILIAMYIKNVFNKEKDVSAIFTIAQTIGMSFIPNLLQFLAHRSHYEKKDDVLLSQRVHNAIVTYVAKQGGNGQP